MKPAGRGMVAVAVGALVLISPVAWWAVAPTAAPDRATPPTASVQPQAASLPCHQVLNCAAAQAMQAASEACRPAIEQLAAFAPRWTQGAGQPIFSDYAWLDRAQGKITYFGNRAEFQNAGGAFATVAYECDFDPAARKVLDARAQGVAKPQ